MKWSQPANTAPLNWSLSLILNSVAANSESIQCAKTLCFLKLAWIQINLAAMKLIAQSGFYFKLLFKSFHKITVIIVRKLIQNETKVEFWLICRIWLLNSWISIADFSISINSISWLNVFNQIISLINRNWNQLIRNSVN